MTEITFAISDDWDAGGTGYAPESQRYTAALGAFDLDCPTGTLSWRTRGRAGRFNRAGLIKRGCL